MMLDLITDLITKDKLTLEPSISILSLKLIVACDAGFHTELAVVLIQIQFICPISRRTTAQSFANSTPRMI